MKNSSETGEDIIKIPVDMLMDIFSIVVKEGLRHEIIEVMQNRSIVVVAISYDKSIVKQQKVIANIQNLLYDYQHYRSWENEEFNWRG